MLVFNSRAENYPRKLKLRWMGPYVIEEEVAPGTFKLKNLDSSIDASTMNMHCLKPYYSLGEFKDEAP